MEPTNLLSLPTDILITLPNHLHNIEDYMNLSSTCRRLRGCMNTATPNTVLRLAAAQSSTFFRPSPLFLVAATAQELGHWARLCDQNEDELANKVEAGVDALMELALEHCGLTMARIRELQALRFSTLSTVENIIDQCVGHQWYSTPEFWDGGVDDAYTIEAEPSDTLFHLIIYGELFAAELEALLDQDTEKRRLKLTTRLEIIKYCLPDFACGLDGSMNTQAKPEIDPRRVVKDTGPYKSDADEWPATRFGNNILALIWVIRSSRWRPHWKAVREQAAPDFQADFQDSWLDDRSEHAEQNWRQRLWENVMVCQGFEALQMLQEGTTQDRWIPKIREWRDKIAGLDKEPDIIEIGSFMFTLDYPWLLGDLKCCVSGFCTLL